VPLIGALSEKNSNPASKPTVSHGMTQARRQKIRKQKIINNNKQNKEIRKNSDDNYERFYLQSWGTVMIPR